MKVIKSELLNEEYYSIKHSSGLNIYVMPKENYSSTYAIFGTEYGSIDTKFKRSDCDEWTVVPEGIAHFLEHKLFESEELDAFEKYAKTGASANAYTSFDKTCYLFRCSRNVEENLRILLDFVQNPYFTEETVQKEQGIIGQEIKMYYDEAGWMGTFNVLRCLYHNHPVKIDIAGTVESISKITAKLLYDCYNTFYNLNNMVLAVTGNIDVDTVLKVCDEVLKPSKNVSIERSFDDEEDSIVCDYIEHNLDVSVPVFAIGYKEIVDKPIPDIKEIIEVNTLLETIAGKESPLYEKMLNEGIINPGFSSEFFYGYGYKTIIFEGESSNPERVKELVVKEIESLRVSGIDEEIFECVRRRLYGSKIQSFNDIDTLANGLIDANFKNYNIFESLDIYKDMKVSDINKWLEKMMNPNKVALSVVKVKKD